MLSKQEKSNVLLFRPLSNITISTLLMIGLLGQSVTSPLYRIVEEFVREALYYGNIGKIIYASFSLVSINTLSELFIFLGAFALYQKTCFNSKHAFRFAIPLFVVFISYSFNYLVMDYEIAFTGTFITFICLIIFLQIRGVLFIHFRYQFIIILQIVFAFQWLEVSPHLQSLGFGKSKYVVSILDTASILSGEGTLELFITFIFIALFISVLSFTFLIHTILWRVQETQQIEKKEKELQLREIESRVNQEMHSLVHDLKTPLTAIQGLISLLELQENDLRKQENLNSISKSVEKLNAMISEILYEDRTQLIDVNELIDYMRAHLVGEEMAQHILINIRNPHLVIDVNRIRLTRVLINLVQNAIEATKWQKDESEILIEVYKVNNISPSFTEGVAIAVIDNGVGMSKLQLEKATEKRFSTKGRPGIGLAFVKKVITEYGGTLHIESVEGKGTIIKIIFPRQFKEKSWDG